MVQRARRFRSMLSRNRKKDNDHMQDITLKTACLMHRFYGRRLLLNDGEVVGVEES